MAVLEQALVPRIVDRWANAVTGLCKPQKPVMTEMRSMAMVAMQAVWLNRDTPAHPTRLFVSPLAATDCCHLKKSVTTAIPYRVTVVPLRALLSQASTVNKFKAVLRHACPRAATVSLRGLKNATTARAAR
jgi:hypothetical protein